MTKPYHRFYKMQHLYHFEFSRTLGDGLWCANGRRWIMNWVTRERPVIDRIACPWLIARSIDKGAEFLFVLRAARALVVSALGKRYGVKRDFLAQDVVKDLLFALGPDDEATAERLHEALVALADPTGREDRFFRQRHSVPLRGSDNACPRSRTCRSRSGRAR
jgi:hypothetical protein